jgi:hypothetical protein
VDADLVALVWLLLDARVPLLVAGRRTRAGGRLQPSLDRSQLLAALLELLPPTARRIPIDLSGAGLERLTSADAANAWLVGIDVDAGPAFGVRLAFRSLSRGAVMAASIEADSLEDVFERLRAPDLRLTDDELTFVGQVLVVRTVDRRDDGASGTPARRADRVVAAHYVRPLARDPAGHVQRAGPAVLATWEPGDDTFEHYWWGVTAELAARAGLRPGDLDPELDRRARYLAGLASGGIQGSNQLRTALDGYRFADRHDSRG